MSDNKPQIQEAQRTPRRINAKETNKQKRKPNQPTKTTTKKPIPI